MSIRKLVEYQKEMYTKIVNEAKIIDPKILGVLTYQDLFDDKYLDNRLQVQYNNNVLPLIQEYRSTFNTLHVNCVLELINNAACILPSTGYCTGSGEETHSMTYVPGDWVPCVDLEGLLMGLEDLRSNNSFQPFWSRSQYTLFGDGESIVVISGSNPEDFITKNRQNFKRSFGETNLGKLIRISKVAESFEYPIYIPALTPYEDNTINSKYSDSVNRHLILRELMESNSESGIYQSKIDQDGNVTLQEIN